MSEGERSGWERGQLKQGRLHTLNGCFHGYQVNIITLFGSSQHSDISFKIRHCETQQFQNLNHNKVPLDTSVCYHFGQVTGTAIMHEDTLAQWLVTIGKNKKNA